MNADIIPAQTKSYELYQSGPEAEHEAIGKIIDALKNLDGASRERVLNWAASNYMPNLKIMNSENSKEETTEENKQQFKDLHDLLEHADAKSKLDKATVVAYWYQVIEEQENFSSQQINDQLKEIGDPIANITDAFDSLVRQSFVRQIEKSGKSQQARKKFRLTQLGIKKVESMIRA